MGSATAEATWWNQTPAAWAENERLSVPLYTAVFEAMGLAAGQWLLDVGCGAGTALRVADDRGLRTVGLDAAPALVELARAEVPGADVRIGDLESLPFADGGLGGPGLGGVTFFNSLQYATDPRAALREARRVALPGAVVAVATWDGADPLRIADRDGALRALAAPSSTPGAGGVPRGGPFALSVPGRLAELFCSANIRASGQGEVAVTFRYADLESALRLQMASGPARRTVEQVGEAALRAALGSAMEVSLRTDGSYAQDNVFCYLVGRV